MQSVKSEQMTLRIRSFRRKTLETPWSYFSDRLGRSSGKRWSSKVDFGGLPITQPEETETHFVNLGVAKRPPPLREVGDPWREADFR
jgi:hypothetical protein